MLPSASRACSLCLCPKSSVTGPSQAEDKWHSMARAVESLGELQEPASLTPLPPLGSTMVSAPSSRLLLRMPVPAETNSSFIQVTPVCCHLSCRLTRPFTERSSGRAGWDSPGWQNLLLLAEQLCFAVEAADIQGFTLLAISPLLPGEEPEESGDGGRGLSPEGPCLSFPSLAHPSQGFIPHEIPGRAAKP